MLLSYKESKIVIVSIVEDIVGLGLDGLQIGKHKKKQDNLAGKK